jgi:hypothetical protein
MLLIVSYGNETWFLYMGDEFTLKMITVFWGVMPCSLNASILKMEAVCSSKTLVPIYQTKRHHIPEGSNLLSHRRKTIKSHIR